MNKSKIKNLMERIDAINILLEDMNYTEFSKKWEEYKKIKDIANTGDNWRGCRMNLTAQIDFYDVKLDKTVVCAGEFFKRDDNLYVLTELKWDVNGDNNEQKYHNYFGEIIYHISESYKIEKVTYDERIFAGYYDWLTNLENKGKEVLKEVLIQDEIHAR